MHTADQGLSCGGPESENPRDEYGGIDRADSDGGLPCLFGGNLRKEIRVTEEETTQDEEVINPQNDPNAVSLAFDRVRIRQVSEGEDHVDEIAKSGHWVEAYGEENENARPFPRGRGDD